MSPVDVAFLVVIVAIVKQAEPLCDVTLTLPSAVVVPSVLVLVFWLEFPLWCSINRILHVNSANRQDHGGGCCEDCDDMVWKLTALEEIDS